MSKYPDLLHPVTIELEQIDRAATRYDDDAREPIQQAARATVVELPGQVKYGSSKDESYHAGGRREGERGYVLFRQRDLDSASVTLAVDDRIKKVGNVDHDSYITRLEPTGHYPAYGNTLVKAHFADRQPSKQRSA